jgi:hypothetical protein
MDVLSPLRFINRMLSIKIPGIVILWLLLFMISCYAGLLLVKRVSFASESKSTSNNTVSVAVFFPKNENAFYSQLPPKVELTQVYERTSYDLAISLHVKSASPPTFFVSNLRSSDCAAIADGSAVKITAARSDYNNSPTADRGYLPGALSKVDIKISDPSDPDFNITLTCRTDVAPSLTSFSGRRLFVNYLDLYDPFSSSHGQPLTYERIAKVVVVMSGLEGLHLSGAPHLDSVEAKNTHVIDGSDAAEISSQSGMLTMDWIDTQSVLLRDQILVLSGAVFGLAAAFLVEFIKPVIEGLIKGLFSA